MRSLCIRLGILCLIATTVFGCQSDNRHDDVSIGMPIRDAIRILESHRVKLEENNGDHGSRSGLPGQMYIATSKASNDVFFLWAEVLVQGDEMKVRSMYLSMNWKLESKKAKGDRDDEEIKVLRISAKALRRWTEDGIW